MTVPVYIMYKFEKGEIYSNVQVNIVTCTVKTFTPPASPTNPPKMTISTSNVETLSNNPFTIGAWTQNDVNGKACGFTETISFDPIPIFWPKYLETGVQSVSWMIANVAPSRVVSLVTTGISATNAGLLKTATLKITVTCTLSDGSTNSGLLIQT